jgi:hypothetical protein
MRGVHTTPSILTHRDEVWKVPPSIASPQFSIWTVRLLRNRQDLFHSFGGVLGQRNGNLVESLTTKMLDVYPTIATLANTIRTR